MAFDLDQIRSAAARVASSLGLDVVDVEYQGGAKHRSLRILIEKNAEQRAQIAARWAARASVNSSDEHADPSAKAHELNAEQETELDDALDAEQEDLAQESWPTGLTNPAHLSGITHEDCQAFSSDLGTLIDVEELVPGEIEYTFEVSSPGLDRKLYAPKDYERFVGCLARLSTFEPVEANRHWQGRIEALEAGKVRLDVTAVKQKAKGKQKKSTVETVEIELANIEKAQLVPEFE